MIIKKARESQNKLMLMILTLELPYSLHVFNINIYFLFVCLRDKRMHIMHQEYNANNRAENFLSNHILIIKLAKYLLEMLQYINGKKCAYLIIKEVSSAWAVLSLLCVFISFILCFDLLV